MRATSLGWARRARATCSPASSAAWPRAARALVQAAAWGVAVHARAGHALAERIATLGFLARELPDEIPRVMQPWRTDRNAR